MYLSGQSCKTKRILKFSFFQLFHLFHSQTLDYEKKRMYSLRIQVTNTHLDRRFEHLGPFSDTATVRIAVTDVDEAPVFGRTHYIFEVDEDTLPGGPVGTVSARDPDAANHLVK